MPAVQAPHLREPVLLVLSWTLLVGSAVILSYRYAGLPDSIPLYRVPWNDAALLGPKTFTTVGRIVAMGVGQAGAATIMARCAWHDEGWRRFWSWAALAAGAKTLFECLELATFARAFGTLTGAVVLAFLVAAATWWRRGALAGPVTVDSVSRIGLVVSLGLWASAAALGHFV